jgi:hypothetical protein
MMQSAMRFLVQIPSHKAVAIDCIVGTTMIALESMCSRYKEMLCLLYVVSSDE